MKIKKERGITLIALVVTIIVLLILAAVSIATLTGENGILTQATRAADATEKVSEEEQQKLDELKWEMEDFLNENDNEPVPEGKYYSIRNGEEKIYYETFKEAYEASVDNGGKYRGGTIVVEKDVTEELTEPIEINKTITINLKLNTMKRNTGIYVTGGTLTVTGQDSGTKTGTIECTVDTPLLSMFNDANINITGNPLIKSVSHAIATYGEGFIYNGFSPEENQSRGTLNIQGGYIVSTERGAIGIRGAGDIFINDAAVVGMNRNKNALSIFEASSSDIVIAGNSIIGNGLRNVGDKASMAISHSGTGDLTIKGNTIVTAGLYGSNALNVINPITLTIEDNVSLYSQNGRTILVRANGTTLNINTKGIICNKGLDVPIGINTGVNEVNCNIQSGTFASGSTEPLQQVKEYMENYPEEETQQNIDYYYLDSEDFKTLKKETVPNLYVVKVEV